MFFFFFFNDTATTEIYTLSLHDALPILVDLGDLIVHVFHKEARLHYDLERLWGDVPVIKAVGQ